MSNLLLLADVAAKNSTQEKSESTVVDASVQTEICYGSNDCGNCRNSSFRRFPAEDADHNQASGSTNFFEFPHVPPLHDYVKQTEFEYLVNSTHDYYNRTAPPDLDLEHSYAFFDGSGCDNTTNGNGGNPVLDDGCFESIANLDEHMGIASQSIPDQGLLCEEVIDEDAFVLEGELNELLGQFAVVGNAETTTVAQLSELDVDELIQYLSPTEEVSDRKSPKDTTDPTESAAMEYDEKSVEDSSSNLSPFDNEAGDTQKTPTGPNEFQIRGQNDGRHCQWENCGRIVDAVSTDSFEKHILNEHLQKEGIWKCLWRDCTRKEPFLYRYMLMRHLRRHTMEAPFSCGQCDRVFKSKDQLKVHERRAHNYEKSSHCVICGKSFASTGDLARHRKIHIDTQSKKTLSCDQCGRCYKDESGLRKHKKKVHPSHRSSKAIGMNPTWTAGDV